MNRATIAGGSALAAAALALSGCALVNGARGHGATAPSRRPVTAPTASAKPGDATGGHHVRSGWSGVSNDRFTLDVHRIERYARYSVLDLDMTWRPGGGMFGAAFSDRSEGGDFTRFALLDPVNGRYYRVEREGKDGDGPALGTRLHDYDSPADNVRQGLRLYFPPIPGGVTALTTLGPGTIGEMTGIPVVSGTTKKAPVPKAGSTVGGTHFYPVHPPTGAHSADVEDLHDYIEGDQKTTSTGGGEEKLALRADVLFAFDKATLTSKAATLLDGAIAETRAHADPGKPPITITGYTDAKGGYSYNQKLSERRAATVEKYVSGRLGPSYKYQAAGKGEADPVAANTRKDGSDDPAGRARNRRVEIGYKIKHRTPATTTASSASPGPGAVTAPAPFHADDTRVIGSAGGFPFGFTTARVDVHPFYRDGAYMVGVFDVVNTGDDTGAAGFSILGTGTEKATDGAGYGGIIATDRAHGTHYYEVRHGDFGSDGPANFVNGEVDGVESGDRHHLYVYYPAPPAGVNTVDVAIGDRGTVRNVPVR